MSRKHAGILLAEGFEEIESVIPIDLLRRGGVEVTVIGVSGLEVTGAHGIPVRSDVALDDADTDSLDVLILPGGMPGSSNLAAEERVNKLVRQFAAQGKLIAAICAAPALVLAPLGVLDNKRVTCYPAMKERAPEIDFLDEGVVKDGSMITGQGPGKAAEFALAILEELQGPETARKIGTASLFVQ